MTTLYKGFSFKNWQRNKSFRLTDVELVKQNLLNNLFTRPGERVGQGNYGTSIQDLVFEPFDDNTIVLISDQVRKVIANDPRVTIIQDEDFVTNADFDNNTLQITVRLFYIELALFDIFDINLEFES
jgi:phage baseplate assembly protein W